MSEQKMISVDNLAFAEREIKGKKQYTFCMVSDDRKSVKTISDFVMNENNDIPLKRKNGELVIASSNKPVRVFADGYSACGDWDVVFNSYKKKLSPECYEVFENMLNKAINDKLTPNMLMDFSGEFSALQEKPLAKAK